MNLKNKKLIIVGVLAISVLISLRYTLKNAPSSKRIQSRTSTTITTSENQLKSLKTAVQAYNKAVKYTSQLGVIYNSEDLYYLALQQLEAAHNGDSDSQFILYEILEICDIESRQSQKLAYGQVKGNIYNIFADLESKCSGFTEATISQFNKTPNYWLFESFSKANSLAQLELLSDVRKLTVYERSVNQSVNRENVLTNILESGNVDAIRRLDWLSNNSLPNAWRFAACNLGSSCKPLTYREKIAFSHYCDAQKHTGISCDSNSSFGTILVKQLSPQRQEIFLKEASLIERKILEKDFRFLLENYLLND